MTTPLLPPEFAVPDGLRSGQFTLEPLALRHNQSDYDAWTSSIEHIRQTPGFDGPHWPAPMPLAQNEADIAGHQRDFAARTGFTYTVLDPDTGEVIGCVYLYPPRREGYDVDVRSWVRADRAELDRPLHELVTQWLAASWPFSRPDYAAR